jgi:hypothetical protein
MQQAVICNKVEHMKRKMRAPAASSFSHRLPSDFGCLLDAKLVFDLILLLS